MKKTVLIADDDPIILMDLKETLELAGYNVAGTARDGFEAVEKCRVIKPDLVLMDIRMPDLDGIRAGAAINKEYPDCCVVLLTAYSDSDYVEKAKSAGVSGYLVKPFSPNTMLPNLAVILERHVEQAKLKKSYEKSSKDLSERKLIEKAKGRIMEERNLREQAAYEYMRKTSMKKRLTMAEFAKYILSGE